MNISYPFRIDNRGLTAEAEYNRHIRDMIEQVLFTQPGERVNRPDFGSGLMQLVFAPNSPELATTTQFLIQGSLQQYMGELIQLQDVGVEANDSTIIVTVSYIVQQNQQRQTETFEFSAA